MTRKTTTRKGYNESTPSHPKGVFPPESVKEERPLAGKPKKEKPAVAEKKLGGKHRDEMPPK